ncbi:MAG: hypothetical protein WC901_01895 [Candidatus Margulisiibacteriota bacterium]
MAEGNVSGGGVHPGKPIIWPTGKSSSSSVQPISSEQVAEAGGSRASVSTGKTGAAQATQQAGATQAGATTQPAVTRPTPTISRPQTLQDISALLLSNNIPDTPANRSLAMQMLNRGFELSRANILSVLSNLEGTNKSQGAIDSALVMLAKEIDSQPGMKLITQQLQNSPQMTGQLSALGQEMATTIGVMKALTLSGVAGKLAEIFSQFEKEINGLSDRYKFTGDGTLTREELASSLRAVKALCESVEGQMGQAGKADQTGQDALRASLKNIINQANAALENITSQAVLSRPTERPENNYVLYNVPNPAVTGEDVVIQVRRDGSGPKAEIDAQKTQINLSMGTKNLGKFYVSMSVREVNAKKNVTAIFNTETEEAKEAVAQNSGDFLKSMAEKECIVTSFHAIKNPKVAVIDFYLPTVGLDDLMKIDVQA